ncbi:MAG: hypothetical protein IJ555_07740 [Ruminococcus sp.]|nr:hypothetical protein [Ruminococcus sp.]MBR1752992.1 hypothetical protein [Ruminococcus sp.]
MAEQNSGIFRKSSMDRISSPEQLTDYLKVTNPGIWVLLAAVILLLGGLFAWSMVGNLETVADGVAVIDDGQAVIMVTDTSKGEIASGMTVRIGDDEYSIATVESDDYGRTVAYAPIDKTDGKYDVKIVTESIHPIKFLFD